MSQPNTGGIADAIALGRSLCERELMLYTAAALWTATAVAMLVAGIAQPALSPEHVWEWRIAFVVLSALVVISTLTWMRRLDDQRVYAAIIVICTASALMNLTMMLVNPLAIGAHYISLLAPAVFAAHFLKLRAASIQIALLTACAAAPALIHYSEAHSQHVISRVAASLPIIWAVAIAVYALHQNRIAAVAESESAAHADSLTGIANLRAFEQHASEVLADRNSRIAGSTALLLIDLDDFKRANTLHGHAGGDILLRSVASGLENASSENHMVARVGGDEFAVLIKDVNPGDVADIAIRYRNAVLAVGKSLQLQGLAIDASVGTAITNGDRMTLDELMTIAERRMYKVKDDHSTYAMSRRQSDLPKRRASDLRILKQHADAPPPALPEDDSFKHVSMRWSDRPPYARLLGLAWTVGATIGLISLAMPDADRTHLAPALTVLLGGFVFAAITYLSAPEIGSWRHLANDVFALSTIALLTYLTGGADSPLWPLVFIFIIYQAWFMHAQQIWFRLLGPVLVILAPLIYESLTAIDVASGAALYTGVLVAIGLTIAMSYNQYLIDRTQRLTKILSTVDPRTGLASRREFERRAQATLDANDEAPRDAVTIVMIDLDNFKNVNTEHGHVAGDRLLVEIAASLASCARSTDCVARVGGDEFAVVIPQVSAEVARMLSRRFVDAVAECTSHSDLAACRAVSASAGFALQGRHGETLDELVNAADVALMGVKSSCSGEGERARRVSVAAAARSTARR